MASFKDIDLRLCHSCGTCVSICPTGSISIVEGLASLGEGCTSCGLCYQVCPGIEFNYPEFNQRLFGQERTDNQIGYYRSIYLGHAKDELIRSRGASGGVVTALLMGLLRKGKISAAIVVGMDKERPWLAQVKIATSEDEILRAAQSKYTMVSVNEILKNIGAIDGEVAFVGLPCHVHGIRKLEHLEWKDSAKIKYCIGVFCGFNMTGEATDFMVKKSRIKKGDIVSLQYRGGPWPGGFLLRSSNGARFFVPKHYYNYLNLMFVPKRCLVCPDLTNEFADVAVGDAWNKKEESGVGYSTIIVRTKKGEELLREAAEDIAISQSDKKAILEGHGQLVLYKKKGVFLRQGFLKMRPAFGLAPCASKVKERLFNIIFFHLIYFLRSNFSIKIFTYIPVILPGLFSKYTRAMINLISRSKHKDITAGRRDSRILARIGKEYKYLRLKDWSFADVGRHWDSEKEYDDINKETYSYFRRFIDGYKLSSLTQKGYVLDICARTGNGTQYFWQNGLISKAVCADFSKSLQEICSRRLKGLGINFETNLIPSLPLPFKEKEFDAVLSFETVEHVPRPDIFIKELSRVVKSGGQIILTTPNFLWRWIHSFAALFRLHHSEGPCRFLRKKELHRHIREAGLDIINERTTVLIPAGPRFLTDFGGYLEDRISKNLMDILGLRQVIICRKS